MSWVLSSKLIIILSMDYGTIKVGKNLQDHQVQPSAPPHCAISHVPQKNPFSSQLVFSNKSPCLQQAKEMQKSHTAKIKWAKDKATDLISDADFARIWEISCSQADQCYFNAQ